MYGLRLVFHFTLGPTSAALSVIPEKRGGGARARFPYSGLVIELKRKQNGLQQSV